MQSERSELYYRVTFTIHQHPMIADIKTLFVAPEAIILHVLIEHIRFRNIIYIFIVYIYSRVFSIEMYAFMCVAELRRRESK